MAERLALLREMLETTRKMVTVADGLYPTKAEEDSPALAEMTELLAARQRIIEELDADSTTNTIGEQQEISQILAETQEINARVGKVLDARREDLAGLLRQLREGRKVLAYLQQPASGTGVVLDRRE